MLSFAFWVEWEIESAHASAYSRHSVILITVLLSGRLVLVSWFERGRERKDRESDKKVPAATESK